MGLTAAAALDITRYKMERTRKKSSKQLLEDKQMKRYFRSKKRSHSRAKTDNKNKDEENPKKKSEANMTNVLENQEITKCLSKQASSMTTNEKSVEKREKISTRADGGPRSPSAHA